MRSSACSQPAELERAEKLGQMEIGVIVAALSPKLETAPPLPPVPTPAPDSDEAIGWPRPPVERVRTIQQALIDLHRLRGKADGVAGAMTLAAIRDFEKAAGLPESGEPSRELYVALLRALQAQRDTVSRSPLPPPRSEPAPAAADSAKATPAPSPPERTRQARASQGRARQANHAQSRNGAIGGGQQRTATLHHRERKGRAGFSSRCRNHSD
jgi:hypothetical protein